MQSTLYGHFQRSRWHSDGLRSWRAPPRPGDRWLSNESHRAAERGAGRRILNLIGNRRRFEALGGDIVAGYPASPGELGRQEAHLDGLSSRSARKAEEVFRVGLAIGDGGDPA